MDCCHRSVVAGIHSLQHVECLTATAFPDNNPTRSHSQSVTDQHADINFALPGKILLSGFKTNDMRLCQPQLGRVLDRKNAFLVGYEFTKCI